jgi:hypothetical protein
MRLSSMVRLLSATVMLVSASGLRTLPAAEQEQEGCLVGGSPDVAGCGITWGVPGSGGSCEVECRDGYMACCNPSSCKCVKIPQ